MSTATAIDRELAALLAAHQQPQPRPRVMRRAYTIEYRRGQRMRCEVYAPTTDEALRIARHRHGGTDHKIIARSL